MIIFIILFHLLIYIVLSNNSRLLYNIHVIHLLLKDNCILLQIDLLGFIEIINNTNNKTIH